MGIHAVNVIVLIKQTPHFICTFILKIPLKNLYYTGSLEFHSWTTALGIPLYLLILSVSISN